MNTKKNVSEWLVIINPNAGKGKGKSHKNLILNQLTKQGINFHYENTEHKTHAINLTHKYIGEGFRKIIAVGGDGTLNEIINGIFTQNQVKTTDITLGMISVGTGNDWRRMYSIPENYEQAITIIKNQKIFVQDVGKISFENGNHSRYFANVTGIGYDALVAKATNNLKERKIRVGKVIYFYNLFSCLMSYKAIDTKITIDELKLNKQIFTIGIGIGKYNGGGMMQIPGAIADDGLFDITLIEKLSKRDVIKNVKNLYDGSFVKHPSVKIFQAKKVRIESTKEMLLEADGESIGQTPVTIEIVPRSLKIISG